MTEPLRISQRQNLDNESRIIIYQGASCNQLAELFNMRVVDCMRRLAGVDPVGVGRQGNPLYRIKDAAARLVDLPINEEMITQYLMKLNPKKLPPLLSKDFWAAMTARRRYEEQVGELWSTTDVIQVAADAFQSLRMSLLLISDRLRDETSISEGQVLLVQSIIDQGLELARERLVDDLRKPSGLRSRPDDEEEEPL